MHRFSGLISEEGSDFSPVTQKNFAMRGSILRNTGFIIGIVVYVGTDTKAHMNA